MTLQPTKRKIRVRAHANRRDQPDKDRLSRLICEKFAALDEYAAARTVMFYVDVRSEVRTRPLLLSALEHGKRVVVPYCIDEVLELFLLEGMKELDVGTLGISEPKTELRSRADRKVDVLQLDLIMVPGVAFDRRGGRVGHGKAYYDKLLARARRDTPLVALAFECQLFPHVPTEPHDVFMDKVITEKAVYPGIGRNPQ